MPALRRRQIQSDAIRDVFLLAEYTMAEDLLQHESYPFLRRENHAFSPLLQRRLDPWREIAFSHEFFRLQPRRGGLNRMRSMRLAQAIANLNDTMHETLIQRADHPPAGLGPAPAWSELAQTAHLTTQQLSDFRACLITLEPIEKLDEPVALRPEGSQVIHVFEYAALKAWLLQSETNPATRRKIMSYNEILKITNDFSTMPVENHAHVHSRWGLHRIASSVRRIFTKRTETP